MNCSSKITTLKLPLRFIVHHISKPTPVIFFRIWHRMRIHVLNEDSDKIKDSLFILFMFQLKGQCHENCFQTETKGC